MANWNKSEAWTISTRERIAQGWRGCSAWKERPWSISLNYLNSICGLLIFPDVLLSPEQCVILCRIKFELRENWILNTPLREIRAYIESWIPYMYVCCAGHELGTWNLHTLKTFFFSSCNGYFCCCCLLVLQNERKRLFFFFIEKYWNSTETDRRYLKRTISRPGLINLPIPSSKDMPWN